MVTPFMIILFGVFLVGLVVLLAKRGKRAADRAVKPTSLSKSRRSRSGSWWTGGSGGSSSCGSISSCGSSSSCGGSSSSCGGGGGCGSS